MRQAIVSTLGDPLEAQDSSSQEANAHVSLNTVRPRGLRETVLILCLLNLSGFVPPSSSETEVVVLYYVILATVVPVGFLALWFLWRGREWARLLVLFTSVLSLVSLIWFDELSLFEKVTGAISGAMGVWLLYWLNTADVKQFFVKRQKVH